MRHVEIGAAVAAVLALIVLGPAILVVLVIGWLFAELAGIR
jgi:hypothetical protein